MKWLLDEGIPRDIATWLLQRGDDVLEIAESEYRSQPDEVLWQLAGREERIVVTRDRGFAHSELVPFPLGVIVVRTPQGWKSAEITQLTLDVIQRVPEESLVGHMTLIRPGRTRQRTLIDLPHGEMDG